jgi:hypothetical protein
VERIFTDLALAQRSSPRVTEIHRPTRSSTRGTVLTAPGYKHLKTPKSNDIGTEQQQIQQSTENNPTAGEPYKNQHALASNLTEQSDASSSQHWAEVHQHLNKSYTSQNLLIATVGK